MGSILRQMWRFIKNEGNNRALTLVLIFLGFVFGFKEIRAIKIDLRNIKAETIETSTLMGIDNGPIKMGLPNEKYPPSLSVGSSDSLINSMGCIQLKLRDSFQFVHISPGNPGAFVKWEDGVCPVK